MQSHYGRDDHGDGEARRDVQERVLQLYPVLLCIEAELPFLSTPPDEDEDGAEDPGQDQLDDVRDVGLRGCQLLHWAGVKRVLGLRRCLRDRGSRCPMRANISADRIGRFGRC